MSKTEEDYIAFWEERESQKGGKVKFYTYAKYLGRSNLESSELGGLLYIIDKKLYFEDFEKDNWFSKILGQKKKYEKTELNINIDSIKELKTTSKGSALNCITGVIDDESTKIFLNLQRLFFQPIIQIKLKEGYSHFFDIMRSKDFLKAINEAQQR